MGLGVQEQGDREAALLGAARSSETELSPTEAPPHVPSIYEYSEPRPVTKLVSTVLFVQGVENVDVPALIRFLNKPAKKVKTPKPALVG